MDTRFRSADLYRPDIDGLRCIAVLAVVFFHAYPTILHGGFVGVDVFFVISGFLITRIILLEHYRGQFSFTNFYFRRIKRIFPALFCMLMACLALGYVLLLPEEYTQLGKHVAAGASYISNFVLWTESGYFDNSAATKPLLHLWSLSIEEQFYIIYPVLLFLIFRFKINVIISLLLLFAISFTCNIGIHRVSDISVFYSPLARFWELLAGALASYIVNFSQTRLTTKTFIASHLLSHLCSLAGFVLIISSACYLNDGVIFPGYWALLPVIGSVLVILAGPNAVVNRILLSRKLLVWIGLISYPLYLWHWPLISFFRIIKMESVTASDYAGLIVIAFVLSVITFYLVEKPVRSARRVSKTSLTLLILMACCGCIGFYIFISNGLTSRFDKNTSALVDNFLNKENIEKENSYVWDEKRRIDLKPFDTSDKTKVLVIGNSFSGDLINALSCSNFKNQIEIRSLTIYRGCGNLLGDIDTSPYINEKKAAGLCSKSWSYKNPDYIPLIKKADVIMIVSLWDAWEVDYLGLSLNNFQSITNAPIIVFGNKSLGGLRSWIRHRTHRETSLATSKTITVDNNVNDFNNAILAQVGPDHYFDIQGLICKDAVVCPVFNESQIPISLDGYHLTRAGAQFVGNLLSESALFNRYLGQNNNSGDVKVDDGHAVIDNAN